MPKEKLEEIYAGTGLLERPLYTISEAAHYLLIPEGTLRKWVAGRDYSLKDGTECRSDEVIVTPALGSLSFLNLAEAHVLSVLRREFHLSFPRSGEPSDYLRESSGTNYPLAQHRLMTDGKHILIEAVNEAVGDDAHLVNASRYGQLVLRPIVEVHLRRLEGNVDGFFARFYPFTRVVTSRPVEQPESRGHRSQEGVR